MWTSSQIAPPQVSVVICTRNRVSSLDMALKSLQQAAARTEDVSIELVVVDNGKPADGTRTLVEAFATQSSLIIRVIPEAYPGLARARNTGLRAAAGEIIVLTDDDCCVAPDYFVQLRALYADVTGPVIIGSRVDLGTTADLPLTIKTEDQAARFNGVGVGGFILGCKMTLMRAVVAALGPVDERLGARSLLKACEDTDYVYRALLAGIPIAYEPRLRVAHFHGRRTLLEAHTLMRGYGIGNGALYIKHIRTPLIRQLYWDLKDVWRGLWGSVPPAPPYGLSHARVVPANMIGMVLFCGLLLRRQGRISVDASRNNGAPGHIAPIVTRRRA